MTDLIFQDTEFDIIERGWRVWLRGDQIGLALEMEDPSRAVRKIHERHSDEFDADMTQLIPVATAGGTQDVRVFSLRGAYLIGMKAQTAPAKAFRKWVLDRLEFDTGATSTPQQATGRLLQAQAHLLGQITIWSQIKPHADLGRSVADISKILRRPQTLIQMHVNDMAMCGIVPDQYAALARPEMVSRLTRTHKDVFVQWARARIRWGGWYDQTKLRQYFNDLDSCAGGRHTDPCTRPPEDFWIAARFDRRLHRGDMAPPLYVPKQIYGDYCAYCAARDLEPESQRALSAWWTQARTAQGVGLKRVRGENHYYGFDFVCGRPLVDGFDGVAAIAMIDVTHMETTA